MPFLIQLLSVLPLVVAAQTVDLEEQVRRIAAELRCPVCQNLSAADSPSELAQQMRGVILEQLKDGKTPEQIKAYFVSKYGEWVLLAPTPKGFSLLVWVLPFVAAGAGIIFVLFVIRRWVHKKNSLQPTTVDPALIERVQQEVAAERPLPVNLESEDPRALLLQEQARLYGELRDLKFDYQAGRLSQADYQQLRQELETQAAMVLKELEPIAPASSGAQVVTPKKKRPVPKEAAEVERRSRRGWQLAAGGLFLLLFGITLGVLLTKSLRPRLSEMDTVTGDFLTGTGPGGIGASSGMAGMEMRGPLSKDLAALLAQGRNAFERRDWAQAIDAFKKVLTVDPNHPEAHTHMGLILAQAGHTDGAFLAFDRALSVDPDTPLALWGKGMLLYRAKEDMAGARELLGRLVTLLPPGREKNEIEKTVAEIAQLEGKQPKTVMRAQTETGHIQGVVFVDPRLKEKVDKKAVLFIVVRAAGPSGGPPLAVKKVERPLFPLSYTLGAENLMIPGAPFSGKVVVSARLDKDGNPMTREPGDLMGEYKNNPVEVGSKQVDIVIDHAM